MAFSNQSIKAPVKRKPHICKRLDWWRVSAMPIYSMVTPERRKVIDKFYKAHAFVRELNGHGHN